MIRLAIFLLLLAGCATRPHTVEHRLVGNQVVEIHTDAPAEMEPVCQEPWAGCYVFATRQIFVRSPVNARTLEHEVAHADGMQHSDWFIHGVFKWRCALVFVAGGRYKVGNLICKRGRGEEVFTDAAMSKLER